MKYIRKHVCISVRTHTYNVASHTALLAASVISLLGEMLLVPLCCLCTLPAPLTHRCALVGFRAEGL